MQLFPNFIDDEGKLHVSVLPTTAQTNWNDCGVFAAAYAMELATGGFCKLPSMSEP